MGDQWLAGWVFRKVCAVSREGGELEKHWIKILVGKESRYGDIDVDCGGKCLDTFTDLRFTGDDGVTLLPFKMIRGGRTISPHAEAWVRIPLITEKPTYFYMYYGNPSATGEIGEPVFLWD